MAAVEVLRVDRYVIFEEIAAGGMASVHLGLVGGAGGFSRVVAIKRMHRHFASDPEFSSMFLDEARLVARIRHPNVVPTLDVVAAEGELFLVMELVHGESLSRLLRGPLPPPGADGAGLAEKSGVTSPGLRLPPPIAASVTFGILQGLHAAHDSKTEHGQPLNLVHRDVSPHNIVVGTDGVARLLDFGVAKAQGRVQHTLQGQLKGKLAYMSPEQVQGRPIDRRSDVFAAGLVLWELLVGRRLHDGDNEAMILNQLLTQTPIPPSHVDPSLTRYDEIVMRALATDPAARFQSARAMAIALEAIGPMATTFDVGEWVEQRARDVLAHRALRVRAIESAAAAGNPEAAAIVTTPRASDGQNARGSMVSPPHVVPAAGMPPSYAAPFGVTPTPPPSMSQPMGGAYAPHAGGQYAGGQYAGGQYAGGQYAGGQYAGGQDAFGQDASGQHAPRVDLAALGTAATIANPPSLDGPGAMGVSANSSSTLSFTATPTQRPALPPGRVALLAGVATLSAAVAALAVIAILTWSKASSGDASASTSTPPTTEPEPAKTSAIATTPPKPAPPPSDEPRDTPAATTSEPTADVPADPPEPATSTPPATVATAPPPPPPKTTAPPPSTAPKPPTSSKPPATSTTTKPPPPKPPATGTGKKPPPGSNKYGF